MIKSLNKNFPPKKIDDPFRVVKIKSLESVKNEEMDALNCLKEKEKKREKKEVDQRFRNASIRYDKE